AISVNMFSFLVRTEVQARVKKGQPAQSTTGVASASCSQTDTLAGTASSIAETSSEPISSTTIGIDSATAIQKRCVMSISSALGPVAVVTVTGSRAIPQI